MEHIEIQEEHEFGDNRRTREDKQGRIQEISKS